eukprot:SAG25_NODE_706_length_5833_cov_3.268875_6_plen_84_part_01
MLPHIRADGGGHVVPKPDDLRGPGWRPHLLLPPYAPRSIYVHSVLDVAVVNKATIADVKVLSRVPWLPIMGNHEFYDWGPNGDG